MFYFLSFFLINLIILRKAFTCFMMDNCYLNELYNCTESGKELSSAGPDRIRKIIESSKSRQDNIHINLEKALCDNEKFTINCHRNCVSSYTSSCHIIRHLKRVGATSSFNDPLLMKRPRRSGENLFDFRENCLFCGEKCDINPDPRNPNRWRKTLLCRTADRPGRQTFKETILQVCKDRKDELARMVEVRINGAVSDLLAADARYHDDCRKDFMSSRSVASASKETVQPQEHAFNAVVSQMRLERSRIWTSIEIHKVYAEHGGANLSRGRLVKADNRSV